MGLESKNVGKIANFLNNCYYKDLSNHFKKFIRHMYPNICDDDLIFCRKKNTNKVNLVITVNGENKNISVHNSSLVNVYRNYLKYLLLFFYSIGVSYDIIVCILKYHYADGTIDGSGTTDFSSSMLLSFFYKKEIDSVRTFFNEKDIHEKIIDFLLMKGKVDYFYFGDTRKGVYASSDKVKNNILCDKKNYRHDFMRIGVFSYLPLQRGCNINKKHICLLRINLKRYIY